MEEQILRQLEEEIAEKIKGYRAGTGVYDARYMWIDGSGSSRKKNDSSS